MQDGGAQLRLNVVADERQIFFLKSFRPDRIAGDKNRDVIDKAESGFERAAGIKAGRFLGADRQIIDHDLGAGFSQFVDNLFAGRFFLQRQESAQRIVIGSCGRVAVETQPILTMAPVVGTWSQKTLVQLGGAKMAWFTSQPDFAPVDIEGGHHLDIVRPNRAPLVMHQADGGAVAEAPP